VEKEQLKKLIEADSEASGFAAADQWVECSERCSMVAPMARRLVTAEEVELHAAENGTLAAITIARESAETPNIVKGMCITFLYWLNKGRAIDFDLPKVRQMVGGLIQAQLVTQEQADELAAMADMPQTFTPIECRIAMRGN